MEHFGVIELPPSKSINTPGWAYVPDTGINPSVAALQPASNKRAARNQPNSSSAQENSSKQDAKILKGLEQLDKDSNRDVHIPVPVKHRDNVGRASQGKVTPGVRKILQSQKTFANYLSDAEALAALATTQPNSQNVAPVPKAAAPPLVKTKMVRGPYKTKAKGKNKETASTPLRQVSMAGDTVKSTIGKSSTTDHSTSFLGSFATAEPLKPHPGDNDLLLISYIPPLPSEDELQALVAAPPLSYQEARATLTATDLREPTRSFCEICGYWGRVKCLKCGTKVCALECLRTHQVDCYTRYGA